MEHAAAAGDARNSGVHCFGKRISSEMVYLLVFISYAGQGFHVCFYRL